MRKKLLFVPLLMAAGGAPYMMLEKGDNGKNLTTTVTEMFSSETSSQATLAPIGPVEGGAPLEGAPVAQFSEVIRFDVSPSWIMQRWGRVTTALDAPNMQGFRTALVTGPKHDDLAGSLTYYFNADQQVQRISFHGSTGDPQRLVETIAKPYGLKPERSLSMGTYATRWNGVATSAMRITQQPVVTGGAAHQRFNVILEINRPGMTYGLSPEFASLLNNDTSLRRW